MLIVEGVGAIRPVGRPGTMSDARVIDAVRGIAWATDQHGRRRLSPEGFTAAT